ncbi:MAG: carboxymuconolactone decarboxylase family protein [Chthoniobacterales bacterium]
MSFLRSLSPDAGLLRVFQAFPELARPLIEYHEALLRGESPFSVGERELIAAYVSGLNACKYCHGVHSETAVALGVDPDLLNDLLVNSDTARVDERMRPVLTFVQKLTLTPWKIIQADADAVFNAGWDDRALHDAVSVCALFNLMNRLVDGLGIDAPRAYVSLAAQRLAQGGYAQLNDIIAGMR